MKNFIFQIRYDGTKLCHLWCQFEKHELSKKLVRKTYLITHSRANESICPDREHFSQQKSKSSAKVLHAGSQTIVNACIITCASHLIVIKEGVVQNNMRAHEISVHFSENHAIDIAAYRYVICKWDRNILLSPGHPDLDLTVSPRTSRASKEV